jgi:hypothetical protein
MFEHEFDNVRGVAYEELCDEFGEERVNNALEEFLDQRVMQLYDNRDRLEVQDDE